ncbi:hypothetical protein VSR68_36990 [Paraburkholderia phymatum]|uniref:hypothetical protein n=1 Tax=Paraburkholderia phymatum TaxID=148447 RepID=UPI003182A79D
MQGENEDLLALASSQQVAASERAAVDVVFTSLYGTDKSIELAVGSNQQAPNATSFSSAVERKKPPLRRLFHASWLDAATAVR